jgi:hypothetical protein
LLFLLCSENVQRAEALHNPPDPELIPEQWAEDEVRDAARCFVRERGVVGGLKLG